MWRNKIDAEQIKLQNYTLLKKKKKKRTFAWYVFQMLHCTGAIAYITVKCKIHTFNILCKILSWHSDCACACIPWWIRLFTSFHPVSTNICADITSYFRSYRICLQIFSPIKLSNFGEAHLKICAFHTGLCKWHRPTSHVLLKWDASGSCVKPSCSQK